MNISEKQLPRRLRLRQWMDKENISFAIIGAVLGCSDATAWRYLTSELIPTHRFFQLVRLGFPEELLPIPYDLPRGRPKRAAIPDWMLKNMSKNEEIPRDI